MLSLWINSFFIAVSLPSFTGSEFSSKVAINNNNNKKVASILYFSALTIAFGKVQFSFPRRSPWLLSVQRLTAVLANAAEADLAFPFGCNE